MTLYRGISVEPERSEEMKSRILTYGLTQELYDVVRDYSREWTDLRPRLQELLNDEEISLEHDTRPSSSERVEVAYACADLIGASYYASEHNRWEARNLTHGLVISFTAPLEDIEVDGKDFLYTTFQHFSGASRRNNQHLETVREIVSQLFGKAVLPYLDRAGQLQDDTGKAIALCDLAVQDPRVIMAHAKNDLVIGRQRTRFKSAFVVKAPVCAGRILEVSDAQICPSLIDISGSVVWKLLSAPP